MNFSWQIYNIGVHPIAILCNPPLKVTTNLESEEIAKQLDSSFHICLIYLELVTTVGNTNAYPGLGTL